MTATATSPAARAADNARADMRSGRYPILVGVAGFGQQKWSWRVPSATVDGQFYAVTAFLYTDLRDAGLTPIDYVGAALCDCQAGFSGRPCRHAAAVELLMQVAHTA